MMEIKSEDFFEEAFFLTPTIHVSLLVVTLGKLKQSM